MHTYIDDYIKKHANIYIHIITYYDDECDGNNNLLYEYAANIVTTAINHYVL